MNRRPSWRCTLLPLTLLLFATTEQSTAAPMRVLFSVSSGVVSGGNPYTLIVTQGTMVTVTFELIDSPGGYALALSGVGGPNVRFTSTPPLRAEITFSNAQPANVAAIPPYPYGIGYGIERYPVSDSFSTKVGELFLRVIVPKRLDVPVTQTNNALRLPISAADGITPLAVSDSQFMEVWSTTNLLSTNWVVISGSVSATNGILYLNDTGVSNLTRRFYRIIDR